MMISDLGRSISASVTLRLNDAASALRAAGEPVIHLGGGEPESKAPREAIARAEALLRTGEVRYTPTPGLPELKEAIVRYTRKFYGQTIEPAQVIASTGSKQAMFVALQAIINPGDEVVFPAPYWVSYPEMVKLAGGIPVPVVPSDGGVAPTFDGIERNITAATGAVIINSPNNPSGCVYTRQFIGAIVELCHERELYLIMDDIYHRLLFDDRTVTSCYEFARELGDDSRLIVANGVSKQYAMTGFRLGWAIAAPPLIRTMTRIQAHQTSGPSTISQHAAIGALDGDQSSVENLRLALERKRDLIVQHVGSIPGVAVTKPGGTFYCFADFSHYDGDSTRLAQMLLDKVQVVTVPGVAFGMEGYLRLSFCGAAEDIVQGLRRIRWVLDPGVEGDLHIGSRKLVRNKA